jgi:hypothetical protein
MSFLKKRYSSNLTLTMLINSGTISRGHATNSTSGATTGSMNAAVFLRKGDVQAIIWYRKSSDIIAWNVIARFFI